MIITGFVLLAASGGLIGLVDWNPDVSNIASAVALSVALMLMFVGVGFWVAAAMP